MFEQTIFINVRLNNVEPLVDTLSGLLNDFIQIGSTQLGYQSIRVVHCGEFGHKGWNFIEKMIVERNLRGEGWKRNSTMEKSILTFKNSLLLASLDCWAVEVGREEVVAVMVGG